MYGGANADHTGSPAVGPTVGPAVGPTVGIGQLAVAQPDQHNQAGQDT